MSEKTGPKRCSRREFLKIAATIAGGLLLTGPSACTPSPDTTRTIGPAVVPTFDIGGASQAVKAAGGAANEALGAPNIQILDQLPEKIAGFPSVFRDVTILSPEAVEVLQESGLSVPPEATVQIVGGEIRVTTLQGIAFGKAKYYRLANELAQRLLDSGVRQAEIAPFGSVANHTYVAGEGPLGFYVTTAGGRPAPVEVLSSDIDIAVLMDGYSPSSLQTIAFGIKKEPSFIADLEANGAHVWIIERYTNRPAFIYTLIPPEEPYWEGILAQLDPRALTLAGRLRNVFSKAGYQWDEFNNVFLPRIISAVGLVGLALDLKQNIDRVREEMNSTASLFFWRLAPDEKHLKLISQLSKPEHCSDLLACGAPEDVKLGDRWTIPQKDIVDKWQTNQLSTSLQNVPVNLVLGYSAGTIDGNCDKYRFEGGGVLTVLPLSYLVGQDGEILLMNLHSENSQPIRSGKPGEVLPFSTLCHHPDGHGLTIYPYTAYFEGNSLVINRKDPLFYRW